MTDSGPLPAPSTVAHCTETPGLVPRSRSVDGLAEDGSRRQQIGDDLAHTVLEAAARRLAEAIADYEAGLDRRALLLELQFLDRETADAQREFDLASRRHVAAGCCPPDPDGSLRES